jgi:hypothetical protein
MSGETDLELEDVSRDPLVASGQGSVPRSVHAGAVRTLGVAMATQARVADQAPPPDGGNMGGMLGRLDAFQSTTASLVGRVDVVEVATKNHADIDLTSYSVSYRG